VSNAPRAIVVGGGLRGALATQRLAAAGLAVQLVEAEDLGAHAARALVLAPPGVERPADPREVAAHHEACAWLQAAAPHLVRVERLLVEVQPGWAGRRAALRVALEEAWSGAVPAAASYLPEVDLFGHRGPALALRATVLDEARLALAAFSWAARRGAILFRGRALRVAPGRVELEGGASIEAPIVVDAAGLSSTPARCHEVTLRIAALGAPLCLVVRDGLRIEHVPAPAGALLRVRSPAPLPPSELRDRLGLGELVDIGQRLRREGPCSCEVSAPGLFGLAGAIDGGLLDVLRRLSVATGELLGRTIAPTTGEDARFEESELELTPALARVGLGAPILRALEARHGGRAAEILERVRAAPREGALVCPCANVIEAELRHARSHEYAADLAAVVRRTEVGIGGCQGVRCAPRIAQLVAGPRLDGLRRGACLLEPARRAALDELATGFSVALGAIDGEPP